MFSVLFLFLSLIAVPALAQTTNAVSATATKIACVGAAVATREAALDAAVATHLSSEQNAYTVRATELAGAYSNATAKTLQVGVKTSWADFNKSVKTAATVWRTSRNAAWSAFRTAAKSCKATSAITDSAHSGSEISGQ